MAQNQAREDYGLPKAPESSELIRETLEGLPEAFKRCDEYGRGFLMGIITQAAAQSRAGE